jgi:hypothetical protein
MRVEEGNLPLHILPLRRSSGHLRVPSDTTFRSSKVDICTPPLYVMEATIPCSFDEDEDRRARRWALASP